MNTETFAGPEQNNEKINAIKTQFFSALDDFKKYYVYYHKNPEVTEFQNYYANSKGQLQTMSKELFLTTNNIDRHIEILDEEMKDVAVKLEEEKQSNDEMTRLFTNLQNTKNGSDILIDDSKEEYNKQYYANWEMIIGIFVVSGILATQFRQ
jgi:predicted RNase H-like nuclease (RuvC/YqgF family)